MISRQAGRLVKPALRAARTTPSILCASQCREQVVRNNALLLHSQCHRRTFATPPPQVIQSELPLETYHQYSDVTMDTLLGTLEDLLDTGGNPEYEVEYSSGVLTLKLGDKGTYVINKQPPNKQIWLSSPLSGPKRYDYSPVHDDWIYARDGLSLSALLTKELSDVFEQELDLSLGKVSTHV